MKRLSVVLASLSILYLAHAGTLANDASEDITSYHHREEDHLIAYLFYAIAQGNEEAVRTTLQQISINKHNVNKAFGTKGDSALIFAIRALHELVHHFEQKLFTDPYTLTTAFNTRLSIIRLLIFTPEIDCLKVNYLQETPLSLATQEGLIPVTELLISKFQISHLAGSNEYATYKVMLEELTIPEPIKEKIREQINKAETTLHPSEMGRALEHIKFIFALPWNKETEDCLDFKQVHTILNEEHYGLKKVKDKILEFIAVRLLNKESQGRILCLVGPPGVGKTSIAKSIAHSLNKAFVRVSLGGVHEESAIRGWPKSYVNPTPGRILLGLKEAQASNPVMLLDEIDKLGGSSWHGDPTAALLEVLDPQQHKEFLDHYTGVPFDLSKIFFIATANELSNIQATLCDRLEIIHLPSYTNEEKLMIAKNHLLPNILKKTGLEGSSLVINDAIIAEVIAKYSFEAGVRKLEQLLYSLCAKTARILQETGMLPKFTSHNLVEFLGTGYDPATVPLLFTQENNVGIVNGLYATGLGGGLLPIETTLVPGSGHFKLTGRAGEMLQESAEIAHSYVAAHLKELTIDPAVFNNNTIHIHMPDGATSKEGPSAGIALVSAMVSRLTDKPYNSTYAMTGEISLTGRVLPIGGIREKLLGAKRLGITHIIIPEANHDDLIEWSEELKGLTIIPVNYVQQALDLVLLPKKKLRGNK
jgi:ATP-dependent Lon protease